jgi:hypothetical protein
MSKILKIVEVRLLLSALLVLSCYSCKTETEKSSEATLQAAERFNNLDKASVDIYPQFAECDEMDATSDCFYSNLHRLIQDRLATDTLTMEIKRKDSLVAAFTVTDKGKILFDSIAFSAQHLDLRFMDSTITSKLADLPKIDSALKQGIPVASSYLVPVVVKPIDKTSNQ